jgi:membrane protein
MPHSESTIGRAWRGFGAHHCTLLAAGIAYYALFSFIPLMTLTLALFGFVMRDPQSQQNAVNRILQTMPLGQNLIFDSIRTVSGQSGSLSVIGLIGVIWASSGMFAAIRSALDVTWEAEQRHGFLRQKVVDLLAALGVGLVMVISLGATIAGHFAQTLALRTGSSLAGPTQTAVSLLALLVPALLSFAVFLVIYRKVPNVRHRARVWPGALLATVLFELGKHAFALYVSHFNHYQMVYGVLGGVMLFMLWTYVAANILLLGAELAAAFENGRRDRVPAEGRGRAPLEPRHAGV